MNDSVETYKFVYIYIYVVLLQTWNEHFFVLSSTHLSYTEEQQQDVNDEDAAADEEVDFSSVYAVFFQLCFSFPVCLLSFRTVIWAFLCPSGLSLEAAHSDISEGFC